jgi:hypothetical protein
MHYTTAARKNVVENKTLLPVDIPPIALECIVHRPAMLRSHITDLIIRRLHRPNYIESTSPPHQHVELEMEVQLLDSEERKTYRSEGYSTGAACATPVPISPDLIIANAISFSCLCSQHISTFPFALPSGLGVLT